MYVSSVAVKFFRRHFERTFMVYYTNGIAPRAGRLGRSSMSAIISKLIEKCDIMFGRY